MRPPGCSGTSRSSRRSRPSAESSTSAQSTLEGQVNSAIAEAGGANVVRGLAQDRLNNDQGIKKRMDEIAFYEKWGPTMPAVPGWSKEQTAQKRADLEGEIDKAAREQMARAANDPGALLELRNKVVANPRAFGPGGQKLALDLVMASPENQQAMRDNARVEQEAASARKLAEAQRKGKDAEQEYEFDSREAADRDYQRNKAARKAEARAALRAGVTGARNDEPGLQGMLKQLLLGGGLSDEIKTGLNKRFGADVAGQLVSDATVDAKREWMNGLMNGPESRVRNSQVLGGADYAKAVQAGVRNDNTAEKQLHVLETINQQIERILQQPENAPPAQLAP